MISKNTLKTKLKENRDTANFLDTWKEIMYHTGLFNSGNKTYSLNFLKKESYGYSAMITPPTGYSFENLENIRDVIQDNLGCLFINKINKKSSNATFVTENVDMGKFEVVKTNPWELYVAKTLNHKEMILDMYKTPHILLTGANNSGKSRLLDCLLTNQIAQHNEQEIQLYLIQLAKDDLVIYEDCKQTYAFADNIDDAFKVLKYIDDVVLKNRSQLVKPIRKAGKGNSIIDYNERHSENKQPIVYVVFDEMSTIMESQGDSRPVKKIKQYLVSCAEHIAQYGRALCVYGIFCLQRPTANNLSPFIKSQSNVKISFRQNNKKSSEVAMDDPNIVYQLPHRLAVVELDGYNYIKVPDIPDKVIFKYITPSLKPNHRNLFKDLKKIEDTNLTQAKKNRQKSKKNKNDDKIKEIIENFKKNEENNENLTKAEQKTLVTNKNIQKIKDFIPHSNNSKLKLLENNDNTTNTLNKQIDTFIQNNFSRVDPTIIRTREEQIRANISKIKDFVPYNPVPNNKITDKTKIPADAPLSSTIKKGNELYEGTHKKR